jgi:hypothetical protein
MNYEGYNYEQNIAFIKTAFKTRNWCIYIANLTMQFYVLMKLSHIGINKLLLSWKYNCEDQKKAES